MLEARMEDWLEVDGTEHSKVLLAGGFITESGIYHLLGPSISLVLEN